MKKLSEGRYELFTTKADAIDKLMQLEGSGRRTLSGDHAIYFYCSEKGEIVISNPPTRHVGNETSTDLFGEVVEDDGKTYVTYYTAYSRSSTVFKLIHYVVNILLTAVCVAVAVMSGEKGLALLWLLFGLAFFVYRLVVDVKEPKHAPQDAAILVEELENRVDAVNYWDK